MRTSMNRTRLAEWIESENEKGLSYSKIGQRLGVSGQAVILWRDQKTKKLATQYLAAIAKYRGEPLEETCAWLDVEPPQDATLAGRVEQLEEELGALKKSFNEIQRALSMGGLNPSPLAILLQDALYQSHIDLRKKEDQEQFIELVSRVLQDRMLAQQALLKIIGASVITDRDYPTLAEAMQAVLGPAWTTFHVMRLADRQPRGPGDPLAK